MYIKSCTNATIHKFINTSGHFGHVLTGKHNLNYTISLRVAIDFGLGKHHTQVHYRCEVNSASNNRIVAQQTKIRFRWQDKWTLWHVNAMESNNHYDETKQNRRHFTKHTNQIIIVLQTITVFLHSCSILFWCTGKVCQIKLRGLQDSDFYYETCILCTKLNVNFRIQVFNSFILIVWINK